MEEQEDVSRGFSLIPRSDLKIVGEKRSRDELEERHDLKMLHLDSALESETTTHDPKRIRNKESDKQLKLRREEMSQVTKVSRSLDTEVSEARNKNKMLDLEAKPSLRKLDLNTIACLANNSAPNDSKNKSLPEKHDNNHVTHKGIQLDLNADAVSSSVNDDSVFCSSNKLIINSKSRDVLSECGSSTSPLEEKDPMKLWKEMKENGFLSCPPGGISAASSCFVSSSHGGIPAPRKRGRRNKNDSMKKKIEIAKREEVDRFTKIAAPSGLLNDLNPGIINHVRNKKQVLAIIQNLVRSEKDSGNFHKIQMKTVNDVGDSRKNPEVVNDDASLSDCSQTFTYFVPMDKSFMKTYDDKCGDADLSTVDAISEEDESANVSSASVLTVKAATVASQWLELLHQDIKGRLSALRRSKKRVQAVITTELSFLILKEFPSNQENDPNAILKDGLCKTATADMHRARWTMLFNQMDQTLSEEERQLESWLNQVKELQLHCDRGLQHLSLNSGYNLLQLGVPEGNLRYGEAFVSEKELAVRAAAASIYSTCNFLLSKENVTCS